MAGCSIVFANKMFGRERQDYDQVQDYDTVKKGVWAQVVSLEKKVAEHAVVIIDFK